VPPVRLDQRVIAVSDRDRSNAFVYFRDPDGSLLELISHG
jgi:catechol 2,3-dioxygenase-like lactoylglutathione lyase family enzyme